MIHERKKIKLTANILFSGIGCQERGFINSNLFDLKVLNTSEINKESVLSYAAIHCGLTDEMVENYPNYPSREIMAQNLTDINLGYIPEKDKKYNWFVHLKKKDWTLEKYWLACMLSHNNGDISKIRELPYADFWTCSFCCFTEDSLILTENGYKKIIDVEINDKVLTHMNKYEKVVKKFNRETKNTYKLSTMCSDDVVLTGNHPIYVRKRNRIWNNNSKKYERLFNIPEWKKISEIETTYKNYYIGSSINTESIIPSWDGYKNKTGKITNKLSPLFNNGDFWWIIGRYMGDGWLRYNSGIIICCAKNELYEIIPKLKSINFNFNVVERKNTYEIHISFKEIGLFCEQFGKDASNKHLTSEIINLPKNLLKYFVEGYITADGCVTNGLYKISTVSKYLAFDISQCIEKVYERPVSVYLNHMPSKTIICGREVNQKDFYQITFKVKKSKQDKAFYEDGYIWYPINKINYIGQWMKVYNVEVENDHTYTVQNMIVHNCQDISVSGKMKGFMPDSGTRSSLLWENIRLLKVAKDNNTLPKFVMFENVKNLVSKKFIDDFNALLDIMSDLGFNSYWKVLNAKNCGVPQSRERVFCICIRKDIDNGKFNFPIPFDTGIRLKDILEKNVEEKYYLKNVKYWFMNHSLECEEKGLGHRFKPHNPSNADIAFAVTTKSGGQIDDNYISDVDLNDQPTFDFTENNLRQVAQIYGTEKEPNPQAGRIYDKNYISPTLDTCSGGNRMPKFLENNRFRKLTPRECFVLMGLTSEDCDNAKKMGIADGHLYKQAGNGIVTNCCELIAEHLYKALYDESFECTDENFTQSPM